MLEKLEIGVIISTHGLKGEVNVYPLTDEPERFGELETVLLEAPDGERELEVASVRYFKGRPIMRFRGIDTIEEAQKLRQIPLMVRREEAIPLEEGEYFVGDLVGCEIFLEDGTLYGTLSDVLRTGANDVYAISRTDGESVLLPAIKDCVSEVDPEHRRIVVRPMREI